MHLLLLSLFLSMCFSHPPIKIYHLAGCRKDPQYIIPYFTNIYAFELISKGYLEEVREYILWYIKNLNYPDRFGLTGTIYDFSVEDGYLVPIGDYDSADSYAATFLILIYQYYKISEDVKLIEDYKGILKDIAYLILSLMDSKDGLIRAKPNINIKYLMDNIEAYFGLLYFSKLLRELNDPDWLYYYRHASDLKINIQKGFKEENILYWAIEDAFKHKVEIEREYPDSLANLFWNVFEGKRVKNVKNLTCEQKKVLKMLTKLNSP